MPATIAIFREADEARTKVCCGPRNGAHHDDDIFCKASRCMAWRWYETHVRNGDQQQPNMDFGPNELLPNGEIYGFCGLAGNPSPRGSV